MASNQDHIPQFKNACQRMVLDIIDLNDSEQGARNGVKEDHGIDILELTVGATLTMPVLTRSLQRIVDQLTAMGY